MSISYKPFLDGRVIPKLNPHGTEYRLWWKEQLNRCLNGYSVGNLWMPGTLYSYVNFGTIELFDTKTERKVRSKPALRDVEWEVFLAHDRAKKEKKGIFWLSGRRCGKSYINAWLAAYEFTFFRDTEIVMGAYFSKYSDDIMQKVQMHLEGLLDTEFYHNKLKNDPKKEIRSGYEITTKDGTKTRAGYNSRIYNIVFKDKHTAANGKAASHFGFEEIGMFDNLLQAYNSSEPCWKEGTKWYGTPFLAGTGGDMEKGSVDAQKMFYDPDTYNLLSFDTYVGEKQSIGYKICFFTPAWFGLNDFKDENGNTQEELAKKKLKEDREKKRKGKNHGAYIQELQYYPFTPEEAFIQSGSGIFPRPLIQEQLDRIVTHKNLQGIAQRGRLEWRMSGDDRGKADSRPAGDMKVLGNTQVISKSMSLDHTYYVEKGLQSGAVKFIRTESAQEVDYPTKLKQIHEGCITIYEHPEVDSEGRIPYGLYIAGTDPYAVDESGESESLGSTFVFKRYYHAGTTSNILVAEYSGRPRTLDDYAENLRKLLTYYNAKCLYENMVGGIKEYFERKHCLALLYEQPQVLSNIQKDSVVKRSHGIHMSQKIKLYALGKIRDYLLEEFEPGRFKIEHVYSVNLLRELMDYDDIRNFDRVIAFGLCMIFDVEMLEIKVKRKDESSDMRKMMMEKFKRDGLIQNVDEWDSIQREKVRLGRIFN